MRSAKVSRASSRVGGAGAPAHGAAGEREREAGAAGRFAWVAVAALLCAVAAAAPAFDRAAIDWQPARAAAEPWRAFSAVGVHYSGLHLAANLAGAALVAALGVAARLPVAAAWAWVAAWPTTQLGLLLEPALMHYGGLSGVLHAGVAVAAMYLVVAEAGVRRAIGAALLAGLAVKVLSEAPWGTPLRHAPGWDIAVAPLAHASGTVAGTVFAVTAFIRFGGARRSRRPV